jgi:hypothetical protein
LKLSLAFFPVKTEVIMTEEAVETVCSWLRHMAMTELYHIENCKR